MVNRVNIAYLQFARINPSFLKSIVSEVICKVMNVRLLC